MGYSIKVLRNNLSPNFSPIYRHFFSEKVFLRLLSMFSCHMVHCKFYCTLEIHTSMIRCGFACVLGRVHSNVPSVSQVIQLIQTATSPKFLRTILMKLLDKQATGIHFLVLKTKVPPLFHTGRHTMLHEPSQILVCYAPRFPYAIFITLVFLSGLMLL